MKYLLIGIIVSLTLLLTGCKGNAQGAGAPVAMQPSPMPASPGEGHFKKGDLVPRDEVCMVNDIYMGKKQLEVNYQGRIYYGCCQMCKERIPKDEHVRVAIDPVSGKKVDKAAAFIAVTGQNGAVSYFENKVNYQRFLNGDL